MPNSAIDMFISPFGLDHLATVRDSKILTLQGLPTLKEARGTTSRPYSMIKHSWSHSTVVFCGLIQVLLSRIVRCCIIYKFLSSNYGNLLPYLVYCTPALGPSHFS